MTPLHAVAIAPSATASPAAESHRKLVDAAQQFEGMFLQQLLQAKGVDGESDADGECSTVAGADSYKGFGTEFVARAIAQAGGLGIAKSVVAQVERTSAENLSAHG